MRISYPRARLGWLGARCGGAERSRLRVAGAARSKIVQL